LELQLLTRSFLSDPIIAIPLCRVFGVETSVTIAVARLTFPLANPPTILAKTKIENVEEKHLKKYQISPSDSKKSCLFFNFKTKMDHQIMK